MEDAAGSVRVMMAGAEEWVCRWKPRRRFHVMVMKKC
jgi:hypothetical protein